MSSPDVRNLRIFFTSARKALHGVPSRRNDPCMTGTDMGCEKASGGGIRRMEVSWSLFFAFQERSRYSGGCVTTEIRLAKILREDAEMKQAPVHVGREPAAEHGICRA